MPIRAKSTLSIFVLAFDTFTSYSISAKAQSVKSAPSVVRYIPPPSPPSPLGKKIDGEEENEGAEETEEDEQEEE